MLVGDLVPRQMVRKLRLSLRDSGLGSYGIGTGIGVQNSLVGEPSSSTRLLTVSCTPRSWDLWPCIFPLSV